MDGRSRYCWGILSWSLFTTDFCCRSRELSMLSLATRTSIASPSAALLLESDRSDFAGADAWSLQTRQLGVEVSARRVSILRLRAIMGDGPNAGDSGVCHPRSGHLADAPASLRPPLTCSPAPPPSSPLPSSLTRMLRSRARFHGRSAQDFQSLGQSSCLGSGRLRVRGLSALMSLSL